MIRSIKANLYMAIPVFLIFIGTLLGCSIVLAVVVKNLAEGIAVSGKKPYLYGSGTAVLTSLAAYLVSFFMEDPFVVFWFFGGIFFLAGMIYVSLMHKRFFYSHKHNHNKVLIAEIIFALALMLFTIVLFTTLQYFFKDKEFLFFPVVFSALLFFVPLLFYHSFEAAYDIPPARFPTWKYPVDKPAELLIAGDDERELIIGFEVAKKAGDDSKDYFRIRAPETWQLSTLFYHFINEYNNPDNKTIIEYTDKADDPYEWWFYKKQKWYQGGKILNPEFSIRESGIRENAVIICERLLNAPPVSNTYNKNYHER
jgi:hypothetical protein